jgi:hypothetical protein
MPRSQFLAILAAYSKTGRACVIMCFKGFFKDITGRIPAEELDKAERPTHTNMHSLLEIIFLSERFQTTH